MSISLILAQAQEETASDSDMIALTLLAIMYGGIGLVFAIGIIWAIISRIRREKKEDKYEDRNN